MTIKKKGFLVLKGPWCFKNMKLVSLFIILNLGFPSISGALDIYGVYLGNCKRTLGTIIDVRDHSFDILTIKGKIQSFPRYQVIYMASYPIDFLPTLNLSTKKGIRIYDIKSRVGDRIKPLLKGWAINFTEDQVSFLTTHRTEVLVEKTDIWDIKKETKPVKFKSSDKRSAQLSFLDPYPFNHCKRKIKENKIIPQKLYSDTVDVKREFDRLQSGHKELATFIRKKVFYPRPEVYKNVSILGLWLTSGARYGASKSRSNNFSPFLRNEMSLGAYSYQHLITTGSGPVPDGTHLETQMHFYYRMKAEYVHLSFMGDPNLLLVGKQYQWKKEALDSVDFRGNETSFIEGGFDYGRFSFEISPTMAYSTAVRFGDQFESQIIDLIRFGLRYSGLNHTINFIYGTDIPKKHSFDQKFNIVRMNFNKKIRSKHEITFSAINKSSEGSIKYLQDDKFSTHTFEFNSWSVAGIYKHQYRRRFYFGGLLGVESFSLKATEGEKQHKVEPVQVSFGANVSLKF